MGNSARNLFIFAALSAALISHASLADTRANSQDNNSSNFANETTESETNVVRSGMNVVAGYVTSRQAGILGLGAWKSLSGFAYSSDGGATFTDGGFVPPITGGILEGDPALAFDRLGTTLYYASIGNDGLGVSRILVSKSTSVGSTVAFAPPVAIPGVSAGGFQDKELIAVDTTGGTYDGRVYVAWTDFGPASPPVLFAASTSSSTLSFSPTITLSSEAALNHGAMPAVGPNGEVYVAWGVFSSVSAAAPESIHVVKSTNGGATFANPDSLDPAPDKTVANITSTVGNMFSSGVSIRTRGFPYIAVDRTAPGSATRGNIYIVFQATPASPLTSRSEIFFTRSTDGGKNWSTVRSIVNPPGDGAATIGGDLTQNDNWEPAITVSPTTGHIHVAFYSRREDSTNTNIRVYEALSTDTGVTWVNRPLSSTAFRPNTGYDPLLVSTYMGDYIDVRADAAKYDAAWGDVRDLCVVAGPPSPCSPSGRGDQDAYTLSQTDAAGPDLFITPWGLVTGDPATWQTPDIFVVDGIGNVINAQKGVNNLLRARVRNVGTTATTGTIRFKFTPVGMGVPYGAWENIAAPSVAFVAPDLQIVGVNWLLSNGDTNNGAWPQPVSAFNHFCVQVELDDTSDINLSNNLAQNNFVNVTFGPLRPFHLSYLIGNPFDRPVKAQLMLTGLPEGFIARSKELESREPLALRAKEIRVATLDVVPPSEGARAKWEKDRFASLSLRIDGRPVGGITLGTGVSNIRIKAGSEIRQNPSSHELTSERPSTSKNIVIAATQETASRPAEAAPAVARTVVAMPAAKLSTAVANFLQSRGFPIAQINAQSGLVSSGAIPLRGEQLRATLVASAMNLTPVEASAHYFVTIKIEAAAAGKSSITISTRIILEDADENSPLGGRVVMSNGTLERDLLAQLTLRLR